MSDNEKGTSRFIEEILAIREGHDVGFLVTDQKVTVSLLWSRFEIAHTISRAEIDGAASLGAMAEVVFNTLMLKAFIEAK